MCSAACRSQNSPTDSAEEATFLTVPISIAPNEEHYAAFSKTLCEVLTATKRRSGEFKVDGGKFGPDPQRARDHLQNYVKEAFTDDRYIMQIFPHSLQEQVRKSCDERGHSPVVGMGPAYLLWDGSDREGLDSLEYGEWRDLRTNSNDDWIIVCITSAKKDFRQCTWKWFHVTGAEYKEWFAKTPATFRCKTQLLDKTGDELAGGVLELGAIGAARVYHNLLWCVPMYVNLHNVQWYTPELRLVRAIEIDAADAANIDSLRVSLGRGAPAGR